MILLQMYPICRAAQSDILDASASEHFEKVDMRRTERSIQRALSSDTSVFRPELNFVANQLLLNQPSIHQSIHHQTVMRVLTWCMDDDLLHHTHGSVSPESDFSFCRGRPLRRKFLKASESVGIWMHLVLHDLRAGVQD